MPQCGHPSPQPQAPLKHVAHVPQRSVAGLLIVSIPAALALPGQDGTVWSSVLDTASPLRSPGTMPRSIPWVWIGLLGLLLLAPSPAGRVLLDVVGGITLTLLLLPLLLAGAGVVAWQLLKRRIRVCPSCGLTSFGAPVCPACGTGLDGEASGLEQPQVFGGDSFASRPSSGVDAASATIDVEVVSSQDLDDEGMSPR